MVAIRHAHDLPDSLPADGAALLARVPQAETVSGSERIAAAFDCLLRASVGEAAGNQRRRIAAALDIVETLVLLGLDADALVAGVLSQLPATHDIDDAALRRAFGDAVPTLLDGVQRMDVLGAGPGMPGVSSFANRRRQGEMLRRMLVSMIDDPRVALIRLAERVQALRILDAADRSEHALQTARAAMEIWAPLAHRLGVGQIKWELEDLAFRQLQPDDYRRIANLLAERRVDRDRFIVAASERLDAALAAAGLHADLSGRSKHLYSIWRKMQRKGIGISEVYDARALRVLVDTVAECYSTLGVVHGLWRNLPGEFDDYIANPKPNGYRSLHTAVIGDGGKVLEVQIRTRGMHAEAELGICAHWTYKGGEQGMQASGYDDKIAWLRQVIEWGGELDATETIAEHLRCEVVADRVYVLTPDGHVVDLPAGATPVDFAYQVHSELGHRCRGARVDGRIVGLDHMLSTGERVEILRGKQAAPNRDWLRPGNVFVHTARARSRIRHWFRQQDREQLIAAGRSLLERELRRVALPAPALPALARSMGFADSHDLFAALGSGETGVGEIIARLAPEDSPVVPLAKPGAARGARAGGHARSEIEVAGVDNVMTTLARCCAPLPGDAIAGYVTTGRGVSVHRADCAKLQRLTQHSPGRAIEVRWRASAVRLHEVQVRVIAHDRPALLQELVTLLGNERVNVLDLGVTVDRRRRLATVRLTIEIASLEVLRHVLGKIARVRGVLAARRHVE
ncbi:MAG TPA: bifunctional (p)ppGpp synthetase/guanosine-3',5'-bis(diphosphate) 3'-pyrophosphohydrolase [Pseudomonadales bacterium]|nr:bifunctional (p)ppGpp synthetase/guanosine-3',5'-bis(diphosphate) 3'-pyrophosphohydrolase [Pseudomonadales bacterium]